MKKTISQVVSERILILDGAMGTMIQQYNLKEEAVSYTHLTLPTKRIV